jgi:hypothetical protein
VDRIIEATHIDCLWSVVQSRVTAHFIEHYEERIQEKCKESEPSQLASTSPVQELASASPVQES